MTVPGTPDADMTEVTLCLVTTFYTRTGIAAIPLCTPDMVVARDPPMSEDWFIPGYPGNAPLALRHLYSLQC